MFSAKNLSERRSIFPVKVFLIFLSTLILLFGATRCSKNPLPSFPDVGLSEDELNKDLKLVALPKFNTFKIGQSVNLEAVIASDLEVEITPDTDSKIFSLDIEKEKWQRVQEIPDLGVFDSQTFVLSRKGDGTREISIDIYPNLANRSEPVTLLIVVTGKVIRAGIVSDQKVGAYIIVKLKP